MSYLVRPPVLCPHAAALHLLSPPGRWPGLGHGPQGAVRHVVGPLALVRVAVGVPKLRAARNTVTHHRHAPHSRTPVTKPSHAPQSRAPVTHPCPQSRAPVTRPSHAPQSRTRHVPDRIRACPPGPTRRRRPARRPTGTCPPNPHPPTPQNNNPTSLPPSTSAGSARTRPPRGGRRGQRRLASPARRHMRPDPPESRLRRHQPPAGRLRRPDSVSPRAGEVMKRQVVNTRVREASSVDVVGAGRA